MVFGLWSLVFGLWYLVLGFWFLVFWCLVFERNASTIQEMTKAKDQSLKTKQVAGLILAAGRSERMGAFKPLLPFGSRTVIEAGIENFRRGGIETIVVVLGQGASAEELKNHLHNARVGLAINRDPKSEMSDSIACGVRELPAGTRA